MSVRPLRKVSCEPSSCDSSPLEETCSALYTTQDETTLRLLVGLFTSLFRKLDYIHLLVTLIHLYTEDRRRGVRLLSLLLLDGMNGRPWRGHGYGAALVQSFSI